MNTSEFDFHWLDYFVLSAFLAYLFHLTIRFSSHKLENLDYLLAGRRLTLPVFVLTMFSTWYGGILGVGEFGFRYGISSWILQGVPYYLFAIVFAVFFAGKARSMKVASTSEQLATVYGTHVGRAGALFTFLIASPAPYVLMIAVLFKAMLGISMITSLWITVILSVAYLFRGGFEADRYTDVFFAILMFLGFAILLLFLYARFGTLFDISLDIPAMHWTWHGGFKPQFMVMWFLIALWTWVEPSFYQRCYAAKSEKVAKRGIFYSVLCWFVFDMMTMASALYARAVLPDLANPMMAYPALAEISLPPLFKGLFFVSMLATIISSLNSQFFVSAISLGRDFFKTMLKKEWSDTKWIQVGLVFSAVLSVWLVSKIPSVIELWYTIGTIMIPGLLIPMVTSFIPKWQVGPRAMLTLMILGFLTSLICMLIGWSGTLGDAQAYPLGIEPIFPGLFVSVLIWGAALWWRKKRFQ